MNEQLIVKNFGPIKDATVDFKRVTVFIGPTGGGKSTLAKLAAIFKDEYWTREPDFAFKKSNFDALLDKYSIFDYLKVDGEVKWYSEEGTALFNENGLAHNDSKRKELYKIGLEIFNHIASKLPIPEPEYVLAHATDAEKQVILAMDGKRVDVNYIPADRAFAAALDSGLAGLTLKNIALPESLLSFLNDFKIAQNNLSRFPLEVPFLEVSYRIVGQQAQVDLGSDITIDLGKGASGMQATIPMMLVINNASKRRVRATASIKSFIIEEPELNLYPTAQQGLLNWLVEKCTKGENDLTITTHSPYLLAHFNTLLFAHQVAQNHPDRADDIAKVVPRESWIDPKEFAAYHVEGQKENGVRSIVNPETGLISYNGLDAIASAEATEFEKLLDINAGLEVEW